MKSRLKRTKAQLYLAGWSLLTAFTVTVLVTFLTADVSPSFFDSGIQVPSDAHILGARDDGYVVTRVVDGDTIRVSGPDGEQAVRLIGIDAPEARQTPECFAQESTARLEELVVQKNVRLEADTTQQDVDRYGRLLRYVFVEDTNVNELMIREGFAKEYTYAKQYEYRQSFLSAQDAARMNEQGLWSPATCNGDLKN